MISINKSASFPFSRISFLNFARSPGFFHAKKSASSPIRNEAVRAGLLPCPGAEVTEPRKLEARRRGEGDGETEFVLRLAMLLRDKGEGEATGVEDRDKGGVLAWKVRCCGL